MSIHFPVIEAGRVRPACGEPRSKIEWTTKRNAVTCPRCDRLLHVEGEPQVAAAPREERRNTAAPMA